MEAVFQETLRRGIEAFALPVDGVALALLERYADRLLAWNRKVNLTAVTGPSEVAERHLVDSLLVLPAIEGARTLLDVGSGAGLPGVPLACARRDLDVVCCDSMAKKVAFVKTVAAELSIPVRAVAVRARGEPEREHLPRTEAVVSRALADPATWVPLGAAYLGDGGVLVAMLGREVDPAQLGRVAGASGLVVARLDRYELPVSRAARAVVQFRRA